MGDAGHLADEASGAGARRLSGSSSRMRVDLWRGGRISAVSFDDRNMAGKFQSRGAGPHWSCRRLWRLPARDRAFCSWSARPAVLAIGCARDFVGIGAASRSRNRASSQQGSSLASTGVCQRSRRSVGRWELHDLVWVSSDGGLNETSIRWLELWRESVPSIVLHPILPLAIIAQRRFISVIGGAADAARTHTVRFDLAADQR